MSRLFVGVKRRPIIISGDWKDASFDTVRDVLGTRLHVKAAAERMGHVEYKQPFSLFDVKGGKITSTQVLIQGMHDGE